MRLIREHYLQLLRPYYETDLIKVITGVRRAGKSILLECIRDELIQRGVHTDHIIFMNLEDLDYEYIQTASDYTLILRPVLMTVENTISFLTKSST